MNYFEARLVRRVVVDAKFDCIEVEGKASQALDRWFDRLAFETDGVSYVEFCFRPKFHDFRERAQRFAR